MALKFLPPGFRFHPTDVELVMYYLKRKIMGKKLHFEAIAEVNIYHFSPWDLPDKSCLKCKDLEWYFFCPREKKYATGIRVKRATENGFWKTTGKDRSIRLNDQIVGTVKTLVFHLGHAPKGERTDWVIYEYKILDDNLAAEGLQDAYALCKLFKKNGLGPKNGAQYGAPFNEADWADDDDTKNHAISFASEGPSWNMPRQTEEGTIESSQFPPGNTSGLPVLLEGPSPSAGVVVADVTDNDIVRLLDSFTDEDMLIPEENGIEQDGLIGSTEIVPIPCGDGHDIYNGLGDLDSWGWMNGETFDLSGLQDDEAFPSNTFDLDNSTYIELDDLLSPLEFCNGVNGADQMCGNPSHGNMQQLYTRTSSSGTSFEHASCLNELPVPPKGSYEGNGCVDVHQMVDPQIYRGSNRSNGISFTREQLEDVGYSSKMERGRCADK